MLEYCLMRRILWRSVTVSVAAASLILGSAAPASGNHMLSTTPFYWDTNNDTFPDAGAATIDAALSVKIR